jgi:hypothetical protein
VGAFFEPPPPPPEPPAREPQPAWLGAPANVLGVGVPANILLARSDQVALSVTHLTAFPAGVSLRLVAQRRGDPEDPRRDPFHLAHMHAFQHRGGELEPDVLRFGVEFSDGSKATNLGGHPWRGGDPVGPLLTQGGGGGGGRSFETSYWLWPLPPPGPLAFVCEWPALGVPLTRVEIDAGEILDAAGRAETLWEDDGPSGGGWSSELLLGG